MAEGSRSTAGPRGNSGAPKVSSWSSSVPTSIASRCARWTCSSGRPNRNCCGCKRPSGRLQSATVPAPSGPSGARSPSWCATTGSRTSLCPPSNCAKGRWWLCAGSAEAQEAGDQTSRLWQDGPLYGPPGAWRATHRGSLPQPGQGGGDVPHQQKPTARVVVAGVSLDGRQTAGPCPLLLSGHADDPDGVASAPRAPPFHRGGPPAGTSARY